LNASSLILLNGFQWRAPDGAEVALTTRKDRLLLAYLALNAERSLQRSALAGLLWGDRGENQARDSLRQSLAAIRHGFREVGLDPIVADREHVTFKRDGIEVDAVTFEQLAATAGQYEKAAALYRTDLLAGTDGMTPEFDAWLLPERSRLASIAVGVVEKIAATGTPSDEGVRLARYLLGRDPLSETVSRALMRLYAGKKERAEALKIYSACRDTLKRELDTVPELATESLYREILTERTTIATTEISPESESERPTIAALPFSNLTGDVELDHICDGITEEIITGLGRFRLLFVIDRYSSSAMAQQSSDVAEVGKRLGVAYLVQGSIQKFGERLRITVRLVEAQNRTQKWAETFDIAYSEIVSVPDRIAGDIVSRLHSRVEQSLIEQSRRKPNLAAYECVLRGIKHLRGYEPNDNDQAIALFQRAIELDPGYALAHAYRGFAEIVKHGYDQAPREVLLNAARMAREAIKMDDQDGRIHWLLGVASSYLGELDAEGVHYRRALQLNPNDANVLVTYGGYLVATGRHEEGIERILEAMKLNPYHPEWYWLSLGAALFKAGRYADALEAYRQRTDPGYWVLSRIAACYAFLERKQEAAATVAEVLRQKPDFSVAKINRADWSADDNERMRDGMRLAGLPD